MTTYTGLPTLSLLPLTNVEFNLVKELEITIPRRGNYFEIAPEIFREADGDFDILENDLMYMPSFTKVLLACGKYPQLDPNQLFTPATFEFKDDEVIVTGSILEIIKIIK